MICFSEIPKIYLVAGATDLRKGIDGYATLIQNQLQLEVFQDALFLFCNTHRNKMKGLYWDGSGFWLVYKRLEKGHFQWDRHGSRALLLSHQELSWLLEGLKIKQKTAFEKSRPKYV